MALHTDPINGNTIAPWVYTDFHQLFTGVMTDQPITFKPDVTLQAIGGPPSAPIATPAAGTGPAGVGAVKVAITFVTADGGETLPGTQATATTTSGNQAVNLTAVPTGPTGTTKRNVYRTVAGGAAFFLDGSINDNTTTTYAIVTTDAALTGHAAAPTHPSFGGSLVIKDQNGTVTFQIFNDGSMSTGAGGLSVGNTTVNGTLAVTGTSSFDNAKLTTDGTGKLTWARTLSASNQLADFQQGYGLYSDNTGGTFTGGTTRLSFDSPNNGEMHFGGRATANVLAGIRFRAQRLQLDNNGANSLFINPNFIQSASGFFGVKNNGGTRLAEFNASGQLLVAAGNPCFMSVTATSGFGNSATFDSFDICEAYECDEAYAPGTVVCPGPGDKFTRCTHDGCRAAMVVSRGGGVALGMGAFTDEETGEPEPLNPLIRPLTLSGRVLVRCVTEVSAFAADGQATLLVSDGTGGVRAMRAGEAGYSLGYALMDARDGAIGIVIRPLYCVATAVEARHRAA